MTSIVSLPTQYALVTRGEFHNRELLATYIFVALFIVAAALTIVGATISSAALTITGGFATAILGFAYAIYLIVSIDR
ncbi:MAG: hypothetical protein Q4P71_01710 [Actinomycetaceae bacterium]|nr:hypothetical protein [Actinomycetaceae bacterium]